MMFFLGCLFGVVLFTCDELFFWRTLSVLRVGVVWLLDTLCMLFGSVGGCIAGIGVGE